MSSDNESNVASESPAADQANSSVAPAAQVEIPPAASSPQEPNPSGPANEQVAEQEEPKPDDAGQDQPSYTEICNRVAVLEAQMTKLIAQTRHMV